MKRYIQIIIMLFCVVSPLAAQKDFFNLPSVQLGKKVYQLKWSAQARTGKILQEFLPEKESYPRFETKAIIEYSPNETSVESEVNSMIATLGLKKEQNIVFSFEQIDSNNPEELWVEYVQGNVQGGQPFTLEWNLIRYRMVNGHVVLFRVCHRVYDKELSTFEKEVNNKRKEWIEDISQLDMTQIVLK